MNELQAQHKTQPRVFENEDTTKGFVVDKSYRSLIIAFYDTKEQIIDPNNNEKAGY